VSVSSPSRLDASLATHLDALYPLASASHRASHASHRASRARSRIATMFGSARLAPERARAPLARARATPRRHRGRHPRAVAETPPAPRALSIEELSARPRSNARGAVVGDVASAKTRTSARRASEGASANATPRTPSWATTENAAIALGALAVGRGIKYVFDTPSRTYVDGANTVGTEYDAWTEEGILEYYWGEHIHLGWYSDEELAKGAGTLLGCKVKDFIQAKFDFVDEMADWSEADKPAKVLDVGCGIGGTSRHLAKRFGQGTSVTGITLSPNQVKRATELAAEQGVPNAKFQVMNALAMEFEDDTFDLVWACESGEHMPDKKKYVEEMVRVLKPGGKIVIATWCQRETPPEFTEKEKSNLQFLYEEWAHPYFISYEEYERLLQGTGAMARTGSENWVKNTLVSWRHSIWVGVWDPWPVVFAGPRQWYKVVREIVTLERMARAFESGLMTYGMIKGTKK